jgi:alkanesulfonate monooxygenase SsuD/methylene tetrahydromethanopterin reductase-like flavin-dependent oxidoreductase (luciferase family)
MRPALREAMIAADRRNIAGEARQANVNGVLPISFVGGPDTVVEQIKKCREVVGAGVLDLSLTSPGSGDLGALMDAVELFGRTVLPRIKEI